jgi:hypothetical protein
MMAHGQRMVKIRKKPRKNGQTNDTRFLERDEGCI